MQLEETHNSPHVMESGFREFYVVESRILGFGIRNTVISILNPKPGFQNPRLSWIPLHGAEMWGDRGTESDDKFPSPPSYSTY